MRKNEREGPESSKRLNALMQTCGFMMSQVSLPKGGITRQSGMAVVL
jgi:hypothetical protein